MYEVTDATLMTIPGRTLPAMTRAHDLEKEIALRLNFLTKYGPMPERQ